MRGLVTVREIKSGQTDWLTNIQDVFTDWLRPRLTATGYRHNFSYHANYVTGVFTVAALFAGFRSWV